jgi:LmbE family N-acetylglucosaminyl deacetylase
MASFVAGRRSATRRPHIFPAFASKLVWLTENHTLIIPLIAETEWHAFLSHLPSWDPPSQRMLVIAPHPDDETLGVGGLIARQRRRGMGVVVAAVTDGENCYPGSGGLGEIRRVEQESALKRLGVEPDNIVRLRLPDSAVSSKEEELVGSLMPHVSNETNIVAPWLGDFHPDHEACGRAAIEVARRTGAPLTFYFFWTWHRGTTQLIGNLPLVSLSLEADLLRAKTEALLHHRSQLERGSGDPILPDLLLAPARRPYEVFLVA